MQPLIVAGDKKGDLGLDSCSLHIFEEEKRERRRIKTRERRKREEKDTRRAQTTRIEGKGRGHAKRRGGEAGEKEETKRREREANVFAREFLLPSKKIREKYFTDQTSAKLISSGIGIPEGMVFHQMSRALLIDEQLKPEAKSTKSGETSSIIQLDKSQERAAYELEGPTLIEAGPGTGKTRTLTARISFLLEQNINPNNILALTFSNKAAEEMRERIGKVCPEQAPLLWMGTFHAFGIELLRKYHTAVGLPPTPKVLDPIDAAFLLEDSLTELRLEYYQNLYDPGSPLRDILSAISRAKDELVSPLRYKELSEAMLAKAEIAANDQDILKAKKGFL